MEENTNLPSGCQEDLDGGRVTAGQVLRRTAQELFRSPSWRHPEATEAEEQHRARAEVEELLCALSGWSRTQLWMGLAQSLPLSWGGQLRQTVQRRLQGEPLQYITGRAPFYGRDFVVRKGCLIPRPETEVLAEAAIAWLRQQHGQGTVLDLGTGSGILAITLALEFPQWNVYAVDNSVDTVDIACENVRLHAAPVQVVWADGLDLVRSFAADLDVEYRRVCPVQDHRVMAKPALLVSNPPYIPSSDLTALQVEVLHEPLPALDGGPDGLKYYRSLAATGPHMFQSGPAGLLLEVGVGQAEQVLDLFAAGEQQWPDWRFAVLPDLRGIPRVIFGQRP